ncbi:hypothetical protein IAQ61_011196 [Plenodomus lingam]|uniref:uncharacterized protein n=1 Tax=Leptosphaeria maculans TaxID=5022 RepID=UPI00332F2306|nr:hypothetical protein IAQ61_011196 [Plenodomus lingam]
MPHPRPRTPLTNILRPGPNVVHIRRRPPRLLRCNDVEVGQVGGPEETRAALCGGVGDGEDGAEAEGGVCGGVRWWWKRRRERRREGEGFGE